MVSLTQALLTFVAISQLFPKRFPKGVLFEFFFRQLWSDQIIIIAHYNQFSSLLQSCTHLKIWILSQWYPEVNHFCRGIPIILIGCKTGPPQGQGADQEAVGPLGQAPITYVQVKRSTCAGCSVAIAFIWQTHFKFSYWNVAVYCH